MEARTYETIYPAGIHAAGDESIRCLSRLPINIFRDNRKGRMKINDGFRPKTRQASLPAITFTVEKLMKFERAIDLAEGPTFEFEGRVFVKKFAVYLAQFARRQFGMEARGI